MPFVTGWLGEGIVAFGPGAAVGGAGRGGGGDGMNACHVPYPRKPITANTKLMTIAQSTKFQRRLAGGAARMTSLVACI
jgi:hypothetical protein